MAARGSGLSQESAAEVYSEGSDPGKSVQQGNKLGGWMVSRGIKGTPMGKRLWQKQTGGRTEREGMAESPGTEGGAESRWRSSEVNDEERRTKEEKG